MFFTTSRQHFFKPLTGKYRAQVAECLSLLYLRLYSANADYGSALTREQLLDVLTEALCRAPVLEEDGEAESLRFKSPRDQAGWTLRELLSGGWLEKHVDPVTLASTYPFTRAGRQFTQALVEASGTATRTRHRNTRNTLNALEAYLARGDVFDLLDALDYSERIVTDFTDVIAELEEKKRELAREVEAGDLARRAADEFFAFMERRFTPDIAVRLSADSVDKHRELISAAIAKIRRQNTATKRSAEAALRQQLPDWVVAQRSVLWELLDTIERRMSSACEVMLPALRSALAGFTKRADILIRQLSFLASNRGDTLLAACEALAKADPQLADAALTRAAADLTTLTVGLIDPAQVKPFERRLPQIFDNRLPPVEALEPAVARELAIARLLDQAFSLDRPRLIGYLASCLAAGRPLSSTQLPVNCAPDLLALAHVVEAGAVSGGINITITPTGHSRPSHYFQLQDEFMLHLLDLPEQP